MSGMGTRERLAAHHPAFGLEVRTPRLTLRYPDDDDAVALAEVGAAGVHPPDQRPFMIQWTSVEPPFQQRNTLAYLWQQRTTLQGNEWHLPLAVVVDGQAVGIQGVLTSNWTGTRTVETGSWLGIPFQGAGIGKEMRAAVLHLAFAGFDALRATTGAWHDNPASLAVTRSLGYRDAGDRYMDRDGEPTRELRFVMDRSDWEATRRDDIELVGAAETAAIFATERPPYVPANR